MLVSLRIISLALFFTALINVFAFAESSRVSAENMLALMQKNMRELSYQGSVIYSQGRHMESIKIHHDFEKGVQFERLEYLSGAPRVIIRRGDKVFFINSKVGVINLTKPLPLGSFARDYHAELGLTHARYQLKLAGNSRVAGRPVQLLTLRAKDTHRFGFRLALDQQTGLLLRSLMVDHQGNILERFEYTDIIVGESIAAEQFALTADSQQLLKHETASQPDEAKNQNRFIENSQKIASDWTVDWLPVDFQLLDQQSSQQVKSSLKPSMQDAMMYSDGLAAFSIFVADAIDMSDLNVIQKGATTAYSVTKKDSLGIYTVTVVGEIPVQTAKKIAHSVSR